MKKTAKAHANIAFIKYWGKTDPETRIPTNNSLSMNLSEMFTITTVEFLSTLRSDDIAFLGEEVVKEREVARITQALSQIRSVGGVSLYAKVVTKNTFPKATGIASSASGFASLACASFAALGVAIEEKELSMFCRTLSGTACRSIPGGFVEWEKGTSADNSYAYQLYPEDYWDICDVIAIVTSKMKKVSSTDGHAIADTSPLYQARSMGMNKKTLDIKDAMAHKDFSRFGRILEDDALNMHAICLTSTPSLLYWEPTTIAIMKQVVEWRETDNLECYFTIDAGPTVHVICQKKDAEKLAQKLQQISGVERVVINAPAVGAHTLEDHLF